MRCRNSEKVRQGRVHFLQVRHLQQKRGESGNARAGRIVRIAVRYQMDASMEFMNSQGADVIVDNIDGGSINEDKIEWVVFGVVLCQ
jgi:hypothetical protein